MRRINLQPLYDASPLQEESGAGTVGVDPADLPLSAPLQKAVVSWGEEYQSTYDEEYPEDSGFLSPVAASDYDRRGRLLWDRLAEELDGVAEVSYHSLTDKTLLPPDSR